MFKILLYYKYVNIDDPETQKKEQIQFCKSLDLKGRVIVSSEGINGTVGGSIENIEKYKQFLWSNPLFSDVEFKESMEENNVFPRLSVKVRKEIVSLNIDDHNVSLEEKARYIEPEEFKEILNSDDEVYVVDMRNNYETEIGKFKGSITLNMNNFRDLPRVVKEIENLKDKKVVTVCTGGVRCEKASAYLVRQGFKNVSQLHGGIIKYGQEFPEGDFKGKCYVFDERISVELNKPEYASVISKCWHCKKSTDRYINCCNAKCNKQFVCCEDCDNMMGGGCSNSCKEHSRYNKDDQI